jgi:alanyl-tRNA synthetase
MIGMFNIISESAVAAGVRRIEAITGGAAIRHVFNKIEENKQVSELLRSKDPIKAIEKLLEDKSVLEKKIESYEAKELTQISKTIISKVESINGVQFIGQNVEVNSADALKKVCFELKHQLQNYLVVLTANIAGKANVVVLIDDNLAKEKDLDAGNIIKQQVATLIKGGGGGQKTLASAGGQDASNLDKVIEAVRGLV